MGATRRTGRAVPQGDSSAVPMDLVGSGRLDGALVDWAYYRDGRREEIGSYVDALMLARGGEGFVWMGLFQPDEHQLNLIGTEFGLHPLAVEDAAEAHQRPKLEHYGDHGEILFTVLKTLRYVPHSHLTATSEVVETGEVMIFCGPGFVITVRHGEHSELSGVRHRLEKEPARMLAGPGSVLYAVCDHVVDSYMDVTDRVQSDIDQIETDIFTPRGWRSIDRVYQLKREVLEVKRAVAPLAGPMHALATGQARLVGEEIRHYFRDVEDHLLRAKEQVMSFDELLTSILQAGLAQVQVSENEDLRRISAWVAILAVPTLIASVYGMNFDNIPETRTRYGYFVILVGMLAVCTVLYRLFKRNQWL
jgi:magnesium transporter